MHPLILKDVPLGLSFLIAEIALMLTKSVFFVFRKPQEDIINDIVKGNSKAFEADVLRGFIKLLPEHTEVGTETKHQ